MVFLQQFMGKGWSGLHNSDQGQGITLPMNSMDPFSPYPSNTHGSAPKKTLKLYCDHILSKNSFSDSHLSNSEYCGQKYLSGKYWGTSQSWVATNIGGSRKRPRVECWLTFLRRVFSNCFKLSSKNRTHIWTRTNIGGRSTRPRVECRLSIRLMHAGAL